MKRLFLILVFGLFGCGFEVIDTGHRGVPTTFGKVTGEPVPEGLYFYNPFTSSIVELDVREKKLENKTSCFTKDTQNVDISYAITYFPDPTKIGEIYKQFGEQWEEKVITPPLLSSLKDTIGQYVADDIISKREAAKTTAQKELTEILSKRNVIVTRLDFTNLDFDDTYEKAVEQKVVAIQRAAEARNKTLEVQENAKQNVLRAQAEAESMRIRSEALAKNQNLVQYEAVQKWDGKLPQYVLGSGVTPFVNLKDLEKK